MMEAVKSKRLRRAKDVKKDFTDEAKKTTTVQLSFDCWIKIFQYLPISDRVRCERVCKLWKEASLASWYNFKKLNLLESTWGNRVSADAYFLLLDKVLSRCGKLVTHIDLTGVSYQMAWNRPKGLKMLSHTPNLRELNLSTVKIGVSQLRFLTTHCKKIDTLSISQLTKPCDDAFFEENLVPKLKLRCLRLSSRGKKFKGFCLKKLSPEYLEEISLLHCTGIDLQLMLTIIPSFTKLHTLKLRGTLKNYHFFMEQARRRDIALLFRSFSKLKNLRILDVSCNNTYVDNASLAELTAVRDRLTSLDLSSTYVTDSGLATLSSSSSLQYLYINNLTTVTGESLCNIPSLRELECYSCPAMEDDNLIRLLSTSENLERLDVSRCYKVSNRFLNAAINIVKYRQNDRNLKINIGGTRIQTGDIPCNTGSLKIYFLSYMQQRSQ